MATINAKNIIDKDYKRRLKKHYGGVDGLIEHIEAVKADGDNIYSPQFWNMVIWVLRDYKRIKQKNKTLKKEISDASWPDVLKIGDRQEMGG